ncbi:hypothetical protein NCS55_01061400 [Fusarium keratoplasticum]|nr:hypothetical protein NCS55_01061400 [Fusarium keratoplasticum]
MFADIQIFTGFAVMISGYVALGCGLQSYHWQLTVYLVWLASLTHLAALSFLRNHFANNPSQLVWRVIAMFIMMMLLEVAIGLAGYFNWDKGPSKASDFAACYFGDKIDTKSVAFESMLKALILLTSKRLQNGDDNARPQDPQGLLSTFAEYPSKPTHVLPRRGLLVDPFSLVGYKAVF